MVGWIDLGQLQRGGAIRREREVLHPVQQQLSREAALYPGGRVAFRASLSVRHVLGRELQRLPRAAVLDTPK